MNRRGAFQRIVAVTLIVSLQALLAPAFAAGPAASVTGRVLAADSRAPIGTGRLHLGDPKTGRIASTDLRQDGTFEIAGLQPAAYQVAVETAGRLNVASNSVLLAPGQNKAIQVAVKQSDPAPGSEADEENGNRAATPGLWNNPLMATVIVVVSAVVVGVAVDGLTDDDEDPASAF